MFYTTYQSVSVPMSLLKKCGSLWKLMKLLKRNGFDTKERRAIVKGVRT